MRRLVGGAMTFALLMTVVTAATAQEERVDPVSVLVDALSTARGKQFTAQILDEPTPGAGQIVDPPMDWEHSTGEPPGYTPAHIDILNASTFEYRPMPAEELFTPTEQNALWAPTGSLEVATTSHGSIQTVTGEIPHDGSQYTDGAYLFGFALADSPSVEAAGRCEYVVWINDMSREGTFTNHPSFPGDPAGGTNLAFGLGINPRGTGFTSTFALYLTEAGGFANSPETDVRAFITPDYVGLTVPKGKVGIPGQINFYTFCVESGLGFVPEDSGADQTGLVDITLDDPGTITIAEAPPATTTTIAETTTRPTLETTTTMAATTTTLGAVGQEGAGFPWWILIVAALGMAGLGWYLFFHTRDPCAELFNTWQAAKKTCEKSRAAADAAMDECAEAEAELQDLEDERKELCKAWPPACWNTHEGGWIEDERGNRITSRDVHMRRIALGEVWADYKAGKLSAREVEAKWREMDTAEFREELRQTEAELEDELAAIDAGIAAAEDRVDETCRKAANAQSNADQARVAAEIARDKYHECIGVAAAKTGTAAVGTGGEDEAHAPPGGRAGAASKNKPAKDPCRDVESRRRYEPAGRTQEIRVNVDFSVITGMAAGSERRIAAERELIFDLSGLARELDFIGDMAGARSAGLHVGGAINGYAEGKYVAASAGVIQGGIDAAMTIDLVPEVPTSPIQVGTEFLEGVSRLGATVAQSVNRWMEGNQIMLLWTTMFYQVIEATPYTIWECRDGVGWVCVEKVWGYQIGPLRKNPPSPEVERFVVESNLNRARFQAEIRRRSQNAANRVRNDARRLIEWRAKHEPGPCE